MANVILFNKPYGVLSQFSDNDGHPGLKHHLTHPGVYPMGRLDRDSEGLLLLSDDGQLQARVADPKHKMEKTYLVQLEGEIPPEALDQLCAGIELNDGMTKPAKVKKITVPSIGSKAVTPRNPPIRSRENIPTSWIELTIAEGRNRQVRRMTAAVGFPTLRLIRIAIGPWHLGDLKAGEHRLEQIHLPQQQKTGSMGKKSMSKKSTGKKKQKPRHIRKS